MGGCRQSTAAKDPKTWLFDRSTLDQGLQIGDTCGGDCGRGGEGQGKSETAWAVTSQHCVKSAAKLGQRGLTGITRRIGGRKDNSRLRCPVF
jgi:hypothetical protein